MNIPMEYIYLIANIPFSIVWLIIFLRRKDLRHEMFIMSLLVGLASILTSYFWWTDDWWRPLTLSGTRVGVEDIILGFTTGGIMASVYEFFFKKTLYHKVKPFWHTLIVSVTSLVVLMEILMRGFSFTSFYASTLSLVLVISLMLVLRRDLTVSAFSSAVLMTLISTLFYGAIILLSPQWIDKTYLPTLSGLRVAGVPIEEFVFWFLAGAFFGPFYEFWKGEKIRRKA